MSALASTKARGYTGKHTATRRTWAKRLKAAGSLPCMDPAPGCRGVIFDGQPWDLAHDHHDRSIYLGPAHARCNRWWAALKANRIRRARQRRRVAIIGASRHW